MNRPCFCTWKDDICERPGFKFTNSIWRPYSTLRRREAIVRLFYGLQKGYSLWQLKPKKGTLRKQLTVNSLPSNLLKKPFFYLHLIDELIYWLKHFDSRNTYLWHPWQVLRVTGSTENPEIYKWSQRDICMLQMVNHCEQEQCSWCFFPIKKRSLQLTKKKKTSRRAQALLCQLVR